MIYMVCVYLGLSYRKCMEKLNADNLHFIMLNVASVMVVNKLPVIGVE